MEWFRVYHDVLTDPKVQLLPLDLRWRWFECLCISSKNSDRGTLPGIEHVAFYFKLSPDEAQQTLDLLLDAGLLEKSKGSKRLRIHGWDKRQKWYDDEAAKKRQQRSRDKSPECPGTKPGLSRARVQRQIQNRTDTETESPPTPSGKENGKLETPTDDRGPPEFPEPNGMWMIMPGDHPMAVLDAREIWGSIWLAWQNPKLCFAFYEHQQWVSKDGWLHAIKTTIKTNGRPGSIRYLETIGTDFDVNGAKPEHPVQRGAIGNVPYERQGPKMPVVVPLTPEELAESRAKAEKALAEYRARNGKP